MRKNAVRIVAVAVVLGTSVATSGALAVASTVSGGQSVQSITIDPQATARGLQHLHDQLKTAAQQGDVARTRSTVTEVRALLGQVQQRSTDWHVQSATVDTVTRAKQQSAELAARLDTLPAAGTQSGQARLPVPVLPEPLSSLSLLIQSLLANLQGVVNGLLPIGVTPGIPTVPTIPVS